MSLGQKKIRDVKSKRYTVFLIAISGLYLAGCAQLQVTYYSDPPGATLYKDGVPAGTLPQTYVYQPTEDFKSGGCETYSDDFSVKWASGAEAYLPSISLCANIGKNQRYTFVRPNVPGREIDAAHSLQMERNKIMKQKADDDTRRNVLRALTPPPSTRTPITCFTVNQGVGVPPAYMCQ